MKYTTTIYAIIISVSLMMSCSSDESPINISGKWQGIGWKVAGKDSNRNATAVKFEFRQDGQYQANLGKQIEKGVYEIKGNKLYTTAEGQIKKMVQITLKGTDTLLMDMNRVGTEEQLILIKK